MAAELGHLDICQWKQQIVLNKVNMEKPNVAAERGQLNVSKLTIKSIENKNPSDSMG